MPPLAPLIYRSADLAVPPGTVVGNPALYTYRISHLQAIPDRANFWTADTVPRVTVDRHIIAMNGEGPPHPWGRAKVSTLIVLQTPALVCANIAYTTSTRSHQFWVYFRVTDEAICSIDWGDLSDRERFLLIETVSAEPMRSLVGGRTTEKSRGSVQYLYPAEKAKKGKTHA